MKFCCLMIKILSMKPILMTPQAIQHAQSLNFSDLKVRCISSQEIWCHVLIECEL